MTREEYIKFANALKNNYTIDFDKLPEFCDMAISALSDNGNSISRQAVLNTLDNMDKALDEERTVEKYKELLTECIKVLPTVQPKPISEEYAKAVKSWLVDYQVKSAELHGRYTPYEVLGWIVNDWRRDNEIW